jgi:hypothetical protein
MLESTDRTVLMAEGDEELMVRMRKVADLVRGASTAWGRLMVEDDGDGDVLVLRLRLSLGVELGDGDESAVNGESLRI